jgi:hypothetical protein
METLSLPAVEAQTTGGPVHDDGLTVTDTISPVAGKEPLRFERFARNPAGSFKSNDRLEDPG